MNRIFSGIQPTGNIHLGNYLGAIRNWIDLQSNNECIFCVVDMHAITISQKPSELRTNIRELATTLIASGIDPVKHILFNQSQVSAHAELAWIFNCVARIGWLNRMTQFKDKSGKHRENASLGLYAYPSLMAADILLYNATHVPVGSDQTQHIELTRDIVSRFNNEYQTSYFKLPNPVLGNMTSVKSLIDGTKKMSKSAPNDRSRINLFDDADTIAVKIRKAKTDAHPIPSHLDGLEGRPEAKNLVAMYAAITGTNMETVLVEYSGKMFSTFKKDLTDSLVEHLAPIQANKKRLDNDQEWVSQILAHGSERAATIANKTLADVKQLIGMI